MKRKIVIKPAKREELLKEIQVFFSEERGEDLGDLAALLVLDFIVDKIGPELYNQGLETHVTIRSRYRAPTQLTAA